MTNDYKVKKFQEIKVMDYEEGSNNVAVLNNAHLYDDVKIVKEYAVEKNLPFYVAIKYETDGSKKYFSLDEKDNIVVTVEKHVGINDSYKEESTEIENQEEIIEDEATNEIVEQETNSDLTVEIVANEIPQETIVEISAPQVSVDLENYIEKAEYFDIVAEKEALAEELKLAQDELALIRDELETLKLKDNEVIVSRETSLEDVITFLKDHDLKSIGI